MNNKNNIDRVHDDIFNSIKTLMDKARNEVAREVNNILVQTYWEVGRIIVEDEQGHSERADYGRELLKDLSKRLTKEFGRGFSVSNLQFMRRFFQEYEIQQTVSVKLTWSHYCELLSISDEKKRSFYEKESINANWSVRELKRQIKTSLFERLLLSAGEENKEKVLDLALKGNEIKKASDLVKDPYVFEFLGLPEAVGQINMYLNYYKAEVNDEMDNEPIGIILCTDKDGVQAEYALGNLSNKIFASKYTLYIPNREELEEQVEKVIEKYKGK